MGSDRYRILGSIGQGGVAEVFEALIVAEHGFERRVAVKRLLSDLAMDESAVEGFIDEARIASRLHHANIVSVIDFGMLDSAPFMVMEHVDGLDAAVLVERKGPVPPGLALHFAAEVAHALDHAHRAGVVHRDLSPKNVMISFEGEVKLADFGIARAADRIAKTKAGQAKGTPGYMAPEQSLGSDVDARADLFGLACALCFMLTGRSPLETEPERHRFLRDRSMDLTRFDPDIRAILARALSFDRTQRHASAAEMAEVLGDAARTRLAKDAKSLARSYVAPLQTAKPVHAAASLFEFEMIGAAEERLFTSTITRPLPEPTITRVMPTKLIARKPKASRRWLVVPLALATVLLALALSVPSRERSRPLETDPLPAAAPRVSAEARPEELHEIRSQSVRDAPSKKATRRKQPPVPEPPTTAGAPIDREDLAGRFERVRRAIAALPESEADQFEKRYLDLMALETRSAEEDLPRLAQEADRLLDELQKRR